MTSIEPEEGAGAPSRRSRLRADLRRWGSLAGLALVTVLVGFAYGVQPQSPLDFYDRLILAVSGRAYGPSLRVAERSLARANRAEVLGRPGLAEALRWESAHGLRVAGEASEGRRSIAANDRAARVYLSLGWLYLEEGEASLLGLGADEEQLARAERAALCLVGLNPTQARAEINRFLTALEDELERSVRGSCGP